MQIFNKKRLAFSIIEAVGAMALLAALTTLTFPLLIQARSESQRETTRQCQTNLKQLALGFKQYIQDYDELYPPHSTKGGPRSGYGWANALQPYLKSTQVLQCPAQGVAGRSDPRARNYTDFWYNRRISRQNESSINYSATVILAGEGNDGKDETNARYNISEISSPWRNNLKMPPFRHSGLANYAFVDGHVKMLRHTQISNKSEPENGGYTFLPGIDF